MSGADVFLLIFTVLGGLALFIFGMNVLTDGLRQAAGPGLRSVLGATSGNRMIGLGLGTGLGAMIHSSAATVMLVGFVNAGLMTLAQTIPPILGANLGTTLSMQLVSFKLEAYCHVAIVLGLVLQVAAPGNRARQIGRAIMGFGLLFLGLKTMSTAIEPHREILAPVLTGIDGATLPGLLLGIAAAAALTAIWQSSGATIAICFALIAAGIFTRLEQVYPVVLGAHIGTCVTALLGGIGTHIEARRVAVAHLLFNVLNVLLAVLARPLFDWLVLLTSSDLMRQTANLHTLVMLVGALVVLPVSRPFARLVCLLVPSRMPPPAPSFLSHALLDRPEQAIAAAIRELGRATEICCRSYRDIAGVMLFAYSAGTIRRIKLNEKVINEIKLHMKDYVTKVTARRLSGRQAIFLQYLDRCMTDIERIGDHIDEICDLSLNRQKVRTALVDRESLESLFGLYKAAGQVLELVRESFDPDHADFQTLAGKVLASRDEYFALSVEVRNEFTSKMTQHAVSPIAGVYYIGYVSAFDRIVRHSKTIALFEQMPDFWIKRKKLERVVGPAPGVDVPEAVDPRDYLDRL